MITHELRVAATDKQIVDIGRRMFDESRFSRLGFDADIALSYARRILSDPMCVGFGIFHAGALIGFITGICGATLPFTSAVVANQHLLYVLPEHRSTWAGPRLIRAFIHETQRRGARDITFSNGTGYEPDRVGKLFEVCGLARVGGLYVLEV